MTLSTSDSAEEAAVIYDAAVLCYREGRGYTNLIDLSPYRAVIWPWENYRGIAYGDGYGRSGDWRAFIWQGDRRIDLGIHATPEEAAVVYDAAVLHYQGGEGETNLVDLAPYLQSQAGRAEPEGASMERGLCDWCQHITAGEAGELPLLTTPPERDALGLLMEQLDRVEAAAREGGDYGGT